MKQKKILFVTSECAHFASTGGLAEVAGSLPKAIVKGSKSYKVKVVMPLYKKICENFKDELKFVGEGKISLSWRDSYVGVFTMKYDGIEYYFIDNKYYFNRDNLYGHYDDGERFAFFSKSIFKLMEIIDYYPDIIHTNDWQTALVSIYLDILYKKEGLYTNIKSVFTIHNIEYQGIYDLGFLEDVIGIGSKYQEILEYNELINLMKGAIVCADVVTTVSPRYSREIATNNYAHGLEHIIRINKGKIVGILNGINVESYNPETDKDIYENYDINSIDKKVENKLALQKDLGLEVNPNKCLMVVISRLATHKGIDILLEALQGFLDLGVQFVCLGTGLEEYQNAFLKLSYERSNDVKALITFDNSLARKLYAASDLFVMPSKSEPCGLSQMIASRYGSVPIVRATGGLYDTITDYSENGNGFVFKDYSSKALYEKGKEAIELYYHNNNEFKEVVRKAMAKDFSWNASSKQYIEMYNNLLKKEK